MTAMMQGRNSVLSQCDMTCIVDSHGKPGISESGWGGVGEGDT